MSLIKSIKFKNYKGLKSFTFRPDVTNILVGPNNCGKSTIIEAYRILAGALRKARSRRGELLKVDGSEIFGHLIGDDLLPIAKENIQTNYSEVDSHIEFLLQNGRVLKVLFPKSGGTYLILDSSYRSDTPSKFRKEFPIAINAVPILSRLEPEESILDSKTVKANLFTHRASRSFRNYWYLNQDNFEGFRDLIKETWPSMDISAPGFEGDRMSMFCYENRIAREIFWAGSGFQIWCQILTYLTNLSDSQILVLDEPEIFLHPDLQRKLISLIKDLGVPVVVATHSPEIMAEVEPNEIFLVDKSEKIARRLKDIDQVQFALDHIGSIHNLSLSSLAVNKKILFVENDKDFKIIRRFSKILGYKNFASDPKLTIVASDGVGNWERIKHLNWGIKKTVGNSLCIGAVFDRDFKSNEEIEQIQLDLLKSIDFVHFHQCKEIENYLLNLNVIKRAVFRGIQESGKKISEDESNEEVEKELRRITESLKSEIQGQYLSKRVEFLRPGKQDSSKVSTETLNWFDKIWSDLERRCGVVPGKKVLAKFREQIQEKFGFTLTDSRILNCMKVDDLPEDIKHLIKALVEFA